MDHYSFRLEYSDEDEAYIASVPEFPGITAHGDNPDEAMKEVQIALGGVIEVYTEKKMILPEPLKRQDYSGQFRLRLPKMLHRRAAERAERDGVSLNTWTVVAIAEKLGDKKK